LYSTCEQHSVHWQVTKGNEVQEVDDCNTAMTIKTRHTILQTMMH